MTTAKPSATQNRHILTREDQVSGDDMSPSARWRAAWRERKRAAGLAICCGRVPASSTTGPWSKCPDCQKRDRDQKREKYRAQRAAAARAAGEKAKPPVVLDTPGRRCALCLVRHREGVRCFKREAT